MLTRLCSVVALGSLAAGCALPAAGPAKRLVVVKASYPGATAQEVADVVAAPIEQQINGVEGMVRIESESRADGSYLARVWFDPAADPKTAVVLVNNRVALARPVLPDLVQRSDVTVAAGPEAEDADRPAAVALVDRGGSGGEALRKWATAVQKQLEADGAAKKLDVFPGPDEKQLLVDVDRKKCAEVGVSVGDVLKAVRDVKPDVKGDALERLTVAPATGGRVPVTAVAAFRTVLGPTAVYRLNLYPAIRLSGTPPEGKSPAEAAAKWVRLAGADPPKGMAVEDLTEK